MKSAAETAPAQTPETDGTAVTTFVDLRSAIVSADEIPTQRYVGPTEPAEKYFDGLINERTDTPVSTTSKPKGGLWSAPKTPMGNSFSDTIDVPDDMGVWDIEFSDDATVLLVNSEKIIHSLPTYSNNDYTNKEVIDFEAVFERYDIDGVYITADMVDKYNDREAVPSLHYWDLESCIWNTLDMIESTRYCGTLAELEDYVSNTTTQQTL